MIKKIIRVIKISLISTLIFSFASNQTNYQTECVTLENDGYITIKIWDTKKGFRYNAEQARKDAVNAILYSGVSGGDVCNTQPPILNKPEEQAKFNKIEKNFFSKNGKWSIFTRSSTVETTLPEKLGKKNWKVYQVSISKTELRKYLEDQKIINSLNNGF